MPRITLSRTLAVRTSQNLTCLHSWKQEVGSLCPTLSLKWCVFLLLVYLPISLSLCLLIFTGLPFRPFPHPPPPPQTCFTPLTHMRDTIWGLLHSPSCTSSSGRLALPVPALMRHIGACKGHVLTLTVA